VLEISVTEFRGSPGGRERSPGRSASRISTGGSSFMRSGENPERRGFCGTQAVKQMCQIAIVQKTKGGWPPPRNRVTLVCRTI
jgi:hypothetical protein